MCGCTVIVGDAYLLSWLHCQSLEREASLCPPPCPRARRWEAWHMPGTILGVGEWVKKVGYCVCVCARREASRLDVAKLKGSCSTTVPWRRAVPPGAAPRSMTKWFLFISLNFSCISMNWDAIIYMKSKWAMSRYFEVPSTHWSST